MTRPETPSPQAARRTRGPRSRRRLVRGATPVLAVAALVAGLFATPSANAGFVAVTDNPGNAWLADTLSAPTDLVAVAGSSVTLGWTPTVDTYAVGHRIYRASSPGGPYSQIVELAPRTTTTYVDSPPAGTHYYVVRAYTLGWESADGNETTASVGGLTFAAAGPSSTRTSSGPLVVAVPAGTQPNDLLLLVEVNAANQNITTPAGWTLLADAPTSSPSQFRFTVWWKLAGASEGPVTLPVNTNAGGATAWVLHYRDPAGYPPNPVVATASVAIGTGPISATLTPAPDVTTDQPEATVISIVAVRGANSLNLSAPQGFVGHLDVQQSALGQPVALAVADRTQLSLPTTAVSPTWSQSGSPAQWAWATIAFS